MNADSIKIECEEDGFHLIIDGDSPCEGYSASVVDYLITDPEALYDTVKREIGPWLYERDMGRHSVRVTEEDLDGYELNDPKRIELQRVIDRGGFA